MKYKAIAVMFIGLAVLLMFSFPTMTSAQNDTDAIRAMYTASATVPTNIKGIHTFPAAPAGFDPVQAEDMDLARYGYPPRPPSQASPEDFARWERAVKAMKHSPDPNKLKEMPFSSMPGIPAHAPAGTSATSAVSAAPGTVNFANWSGFANTNKLTNWNKATSFYEVVSEFNTPVAQEPFGACDGTTDEEVSWNGIDGFSNGDVVQGGSLSEARCVSDVTTTSYCDWIEWFPSYGITCVIYPSTPGDDVYAVTLDTGGGGTTGTAQTVCVVDETLNTGSCYLIDWLTGPGLVGSSAEYIVERPGYNNGSCVIVFDDTCLFPLVNYVNDFWAYSEAWTFTEYNNYVNKGTKTPNFPGSTATTTYLINMTNDGDTQVISSATAEGDFGIVFFDEGCANTGGCTP
jgi:hypothetical protein